MNTVLFPPFLSHIDKNWLSCKILGFRLLDVMETLILVHSKSFADYLLHFSVCFGHVAHSYCWLLELGTRVRLYKLMSCSNFYFLSQYMYGLLNASLFLLFLFLFIYSKVVLVPDLFFEPNKSISALNYARSIIFYYIIKVQAWLLGS